MVDRLVENMDLVKPILTEDRGCEHLVPKWQDIDVLEAVQKGLEPVAELTDTMCGEKYVTVSSLKALYEDLETTTLALDESPDVPDLVNDMRGVIMDKLKEKADGSDGILNLTSFLDPRYKVSKCAIQLILLFLFAAIFMLTCDPQNLSQL